MAAIPFKIEAQATTFWCWAAVSLSVDNFYPAPPPKHLDQCTLVGQALGRPDCCGAPSPCANIEKGLLAGLVRVARFKDGPKNPSPALFAAIVAELVGGRPVCIRTEHSPGAGHFVVISACEQNATGQWLTLENPDGPVHHPDVNFATFPTIGHPGLGRWTDAYFTNP